MANGPINPDQLVISREEFARVMNTWTIHVVQLLRPWVDADPAAARKHVRGCNRAFVGAVAGETRNRFLQDHAIEFAKALEEALVGESINAKLSGRTNAERKQAKKTIPVSKPRREIIRARPSKDIGD